MTDPKRTLTPEEEKGFEAGVEFAREEDYPSWTKAWNEYFAKVIPNSQSTGSTEFKRGFARGFTKENKALRRGSRPEKERRK